MTPITYRRRWYQYSLRTLLIFMTVAGCGFGWLGKEAQKVRERAAILDQMKAEWGPFGRCGDPMEVWQLTFDSSKLSWSRRLLGDQYLELAVSYPKLSPEELKRIQTAFPEATVRQRDR